MSILKKDKYYDLHLNEDIQLAKMLNCKLDLTLYNEHELSNLVFNTYDLYILMQLNDLQPLKDAINQKYNYSKMQYDILIEDIEEHLKELKKGG